MILARKGDELSRGQAHDYRTHERADGRTHRQMQATTIPEDQNWPRVKIVDHSDVVGVSSVDAAPTSSSFPT